MIFKKPLIISTLFLLFLGASISFADQALVQRVSDSVRGNVKVSYHAGTKQVRFLGAPPSVSLPQPFSLKPGVLPEHAAASFLGVYGRLFGLADPDQELSLKHVRNLSEGRSVVKFNQIYKGIPVIAGQMIVNMDRARNIKSISGEISPRIALDTTPKVELQRAERKAFAAVSRKYQVSEEHLEVLSSELSVYNPVLLGHQMNRNFLVWKLIIRCDDPPVRELAIVDAKNGMILLSFNQIDTALDRIIYDNENDPLADLPGYGPMRSEGESPLPSPDGDEANYAYDYLGDTYNFYWTYHERDSIDNAGMSLIATVRYCDYLYYLLGYCPYPNAYWDGSQMVFGDGFAAADDVVGHELTHGVTENESALFYYMQSGAINESFSDIWGEFIDQWNGAGKDGDDWDWKLGEDLPISTGIIRNMKNPPAFKDPDSMLSTYYYCKSDDNGGVHTNGGVNNKVAYLLTDGGTFNGYTVGSLGMEKVAKIYYEVQTNLLTSGADYQDLADALYQGCSNLNVGGTTTASDCDEVQKAVKAVHMHALPDKCKNVDAPLCNSGTATDVFFDDMEDTGSGNWISAALSGPNEWYYPQNPNGYIDATYTTSGEYNIWGYDYGDVADYYIAMNASVTLPPSGNIFMHFNHAYDFDHAVISGTTRYYDGGILEYSLDDGTTWQDAQNLIVVNGYDGRLDSSWGNPLGGRSAFAGTSHGYISTKLDLSSLAGQSVRFRFRIGTDSMFDSWGWFIDDVRIYTCSDPDPLSMTLTYPNGGEIVGTGEPATITWSGPSKMAYATLHYSIDKGLTWKTIEKNVPGNEYLWTVPFLTKNQSKCFVRVTGYDSKGVKLGADKSNGLFAIHVVNVSSPDGGEGWDSGGSYDITWTTHETKNAVDSVQLYYTMNGGTTWTLINTLPGVDPGDHTYTWNPLPTVTVDKTKCKVKVVLKDIVGNILGSDVSDGFFSILKPIL